ncbi:MAG TPA: cytochrome c oxidase subunit 3 [Polyangiaceae bacterium]|nr:cytochrome c oxidase subunit 3 [Polyangiaceae bacterium]
MNLDASGGHLGNVVRLRAPARRPIASNGVIGMILFVVAETMFFAGLISAFTIVKTTAVGGWPPLGQPRLPVERTAVNTLALLSSGPLLWLAARRFARGQPRVMQALLGAIGLGAFFVVFQGAEWVALLAEGLTVRSSTHSGFFYLIVGAHGLHAVAALAGLFASARRLSTGRLSPAFFSTAQIFWYFVVALWPVLYWRVYL